eukprot:CAMPEP_0113943828 /NCGR_PEP_ID=MMETSP1339-20121228/28399_1 /TAXON_ID=94617 /ORGANISM="Fibrocapsa japonica" /LENGTH=98 /DNA_ID=CAMNT_0000948795 /DNA_START=58 /DNA_END=354 /DNA_ORIENTATION=+ /assembly_acc=CAM_ASM_000762
MSKKRKVDDESDHSVEEADSDEESGSKAPRTMFELGKMKKVNVRTFKGRVLIDIREYYLHSDSGEERPGKKGISLNPDQWEALKEIMSDVDNAIEHVK